MRAMSRSSFKYKGKGKTHNTVSGLFQKSLNELMKRTFAASPQFVRCIKPNYEKLPRLCDDEFMTKQLTLVHIHPHTCISFNSVKYEHSISCDDADFNTQPFPHPLPPPSNPIPLSLLNIHKIRTN